MALNDGIMDDIENVDGTVLPPSPVEPTGDPIVLKTEVRDVFEEPQDHEAPPVIQELPRLDVAFKLVGEKSDKIVELQDVISDIEGVGTMSQDTADVVEATFENFYGDFRRAEFTKMPSRTNVGGTLSFMRGRVRLALEELQSRFHTFLAAPVDDAKACVDRIQTTYAPALEMDLMRVQIQAAEQKSHMLQSKNLVVHYDGAFRDLRDMDLLTLDVDKLTTSGKDHGPLKAALKNLTLYWNDSLIWRAQVSASLDCGHVDADASQQDLHLSSSTTLSLTPKQLVELLSSGSLWGTYSYLEEQALKAIAEIEKVQKDGETIAENALAVQNYVVTNGEAIHKFSRAIENYCGYTAKAVESLATLETLVRELAYY